MDSTDSAVERLLRRDRLALGGVMALLFALAAFYTVFGVGMRMSALEMTAMGGMRDMPAPDVVPGRWSSGYALLVFLMWWVMMIAMMLPGITPTILLHTALLRHSGAGGGAPRQALGFMAGYLVAWAGFSALATSAQWGLEAAGLVSATMMTLIDSLPGGLVLIAAGLFQFTPMKSACLAHCRSPAKFLTERRRPGLSGVFAMGVEHGVFCLGCCWALMALLFVGGIMNLYWIVALAAFAALERLTPFGEILSKGAGAFLVIWGTVVIAQIG